MKLMSLYRVIAASLGAACLLVSALATAQAYPGRPLKMIVPFPAGGTTDLVARLLAQRMSESMGQPVTVENKPGAGGAIGSDAVAKARPDGYTLLMHNTTLVFSSVTQTLAKRATFDAQKDLAAVGIAVTVPFIFTAPPSIPAADLKEFARLLKSNPGLQYNYGSTGPGSAMHVMGETFKRVAGVNMEHVAFRGAAPLKQDLLAGLIQLGGDQLPTSQSEIKAGTLKALATNARQRIPSLPDVPTVRELGYPQLELEGWNGVFVPAGVPSPVLERLHRELTAAVEHPDVSRRLSELGAEPVGSSPADLDAILRRQMEQVYPVIRDMKLE